MKTSESCNYNLLDLLSIGLGATIGSGVFVVTGQVAKDGVGPSIVGSWILAAIACCLSAASFAELSCRLPDSCSSYSFVRKAMGEFPAVIAASCMTLECGISAASVARSWAVKVNILIHEHFPSITFFGSNNIDSGLNLTATVLMLVVTLIFLSGVNSSKQTVNVLTAMKMTIIGMIIIVGFYIFDEGNLRPLAPGGVHGVLRGAATCFFGYVGYDEVINIICQVLVIQLNLKLGLLRSDGNKESSKADSTSDFWHYYDFRGNLRAERTCVGRYAEL